jgi:hypothetical protein
MDPMGLAMTQNTSFFGKKNMGKPQDPLICSPHCHPNGRFVARIFISKKVDHPNVATGQWLFEAFFGSCPTSWMG